MNKDVVCHVILGYKVYTYIYKHLCGGAQYGKYIDIYGYIIILDIFATEMPCFRYFPCLSTGIYL